MAVMKSRPPDFSLAHEVACPSLPENLGRFSLILRARPPGSSSLRRNLRDGGVFANKT